MKNLDYTVALFVDLLNEKNLSQNSISAYKRDVELFLNWYENQTWSDNIILQYSEHSIKNKLATATLDRKIRAINQWIKFCQLELQLNLNATLPKIKRERKNFNIMNNDKISEILKNINSNDMFSIRLKAIVHMLYSTGLRVSEIIKIKSSDIKYVIEKDAKSFRVIGKGKKERQVFMTSNAISALKTYCNAKEESKSEYIWNSGKSHITRQSVFLWLQKLGVSPHDFRHKLASDLVHKGMNLLEVQKVLGHSSVKTTSLYTHTVNAEQIVKKYHPLSKK